MPQQVFRTGIDIGSTTVKAVLLDSGFNCIFSDYRRHHANISHTLSELFADIEKAVGGDALLTVQMTGSGSINLAKKLGIVFVQEVIAEADAIKKLAPQTDTAIELGGEDAKIIYFTGGLEQRMNGVCAGGTGSFIDQMAALLQTDAHGLNEYAKNAKQLYPIAARCGVFAKSDIQPLINEGATREDLSASILQSVVNQTISGLACGKPIRGNIAFLGGPLHYLDGLTAAFVRTLRLKPEQVIIPENSHLFAAVGAAVYDGEENEAVTVGELRRRLSAVGEMNFELLRLEPLFESKEDYRQFSERHAGDSVKKGDIASYCGGCYLGIDAGSTTTKLALIGKSGELLWSFYSGNSGSPVKTAIRAVTQLRDILPNSASILCAYSTGYGEQLLKSAFNLDGGEVETVAHCTAARFFDPDADCVMDIGGQDMKCVKLKSGAVDSVLLNEACSSGCGSFIENFAQSLGYSAEEFASLALYAKAPLDLGTRCTVFMNSNVKQAQKEGASVSDISAGLAYSVIKNALFKVIKLSDARSLGSHVIAQGGTFCNHAVLRAFEKITGCEVVCPDISRLMGAFGAALIARQNSSGSSSMLPLGEIAELEYETAVTHCNGCTNSCLLTINRFSGGKKYVTGNRCEKGFGKAQPDTSVPNVMAQKYRRMFDYEPLGESEATMGVIGIPRVLNMYENYPYWATLFRALGFCVMLSPGSDRSIYARGIESIPSESMCYPAKLAHGHIQYLIDSGIKTIFYPSIYYERREPAAQNRYNCPIVIGCPENINNNVDDISAKGVRFLHPFLSLCDEKTAEDRLCGFFKDEFNIKPSEVRAAARLAWKELQRAKDDVRTFGAQALEWIRENNARGIVVAGRPYHCDPEINHGIDKLICSYGFAVLTEDSLPKNDSPTRPLRVNDQWSYHSRLYTAAEYVVHNRRLDLLQLNSFGCGLDAVTSDQINEILTKGNRLYTLLKIDEISNLGAARIRIRSLIAAINERSDNLPDPDTDNNRDIDISYSRSVFTKEMRDSRYTIIAPQMAPMHFKMVQAAFERGGYNFVILDNDTRASVDTGLKYVNNDACYPSLIMTGQLINAVLSGKYDTDRLALLMTQTGGCCRATNYISFIRRALDSAGLPHIPVISLNVGKIEENPGFKVTLDMLTDGGAALIWGDLVMKCLYRMRPYELEKGSANALRDRELDKCCRLILDGKVSLRTFAERCREIVSAFDALPIDEQLVLPKVGIVGEILVKYMPLANNRLVELLEREGAEAVVPDFTDFFEFSAYGYKYRHKYLGGSKKSSVFGGMFVDVLEWFRKSAEKALRDSRHFEPHARIEELAKIAEPYISLGNKYGEGWFLTAEMVHLIQTGTPNIVCIQPFGCLPNHIVGKGVIKTVRSRNPNANVVAVDYDPGASEVNQLNRIKLMLTAAKQAIKQNSTHMVTPPHITVAEQCAEDETDTCTTKR